MTPQSDNRAPGYVKANDPDAIPDDPTTSRGEKLSALRSRAISEYGDIPPDLLAEIENSSEGKDSPNAGNASRKASR